MRSHTLLLPLLALACSPGFDITPYSTGQSRFPIGAKCESSGECASSICADKVCCVHECESFASCGVSGHEGDCTPRMLGASCSDSAPCAPAADGSPVPCVDGVCCEGTCDGLCQSCAVTGHEGQCRDAPDNSDARAQCGKCWACFSGACAPATVGSDPKGLCAAEGDTQGLSLVCSAQQQCAPKLGSACKTTADCALGECIGDRCLLAEVESVFVFPMRQASTARYLGGATLDSSGAISLLFTEEQVFRDCSGCTPAVCSSSCYGKLWHLDHTLGIATRSSTGVWTGRRVFSDRYDSGGMPAAIASLGRWLYVASYSGHLSRNSGENCDAAPPPLGNAVDPDAVPCGIFGQLIGPDGAEGPFETITHRGFVGSEAGLVWIGLLALPNGDLALGYATGDAIFLKLRNASMHLWGEETTVAKPAQAEAYFDRFQLVQIDGGGAFVYREHSSLDAPHMGLTPFDGDGKVGARSNLGPVSGMSPTHCDARDIKAAAVADAGGDAVLAVFRCSCNYPLSDQCRSDDLSFLATWRDVTGWSAPLMSPASARLSDLGPLSIPFPSSSWPWLLGGNWSNISDVGLSWQRNGSTDYDSAGSQALLPGAVLSDLVAIRGADGEPILAGIPAWIDFTLPSLAPDLLVYRYHP